MRSFALQRKKDVKALQMRAVVSVNLEGTT